MLEYITLKNKTLSDKDGYMDLLDETFHIPSEFEFTILDVNEAYVARPELISLDAYGDDIYADIICKLNGIGNPFEINEGMQLILPTPEDLDKFILFIEPSEKNKDEDKNNDEQRHNNIRKSPSQALQGDKRFKIKDNVIIY